ncbi:pyruvate oxidase [Dellaglioa carnosa]|uniref:pyruvate oxidase n=1 Tax=Dellaglioa carnosa TaxID=2995136 RepID=UPI0022A86E40|nr:pyruvate oxidase [Dellaglioa carnosa]MCZ2493103.1 pyruvate oxidase [Dellaglioa carnosa]
MSEKIKASIAMLKVLQDWKVENVYGLPGGSFNTTMRALESEKENINYIQVRHEEVGALAAAAEAKLTGKVGVVFGSAGPGATHLFNGLYDAQQDHVPVLALIGQVASSAMNMDSFQEMNENPMFADVSVYNRTVMTPESLPRVIDQAIRTAYQYKGVAVVTIPNDYGWMDIDMDSYYASGHNYSSPILPEPDDSKIKDALALIKEAKRPVLFAGIGTKGATDEVIAFSEHFKMPVIITAINKGTVPDSYRANLGSTYRVATKPADEAIEAADLVVFAGADLPFAQTKKILKPNMKFIQIDIDASKIGKRHAVDVALLSDAKKTLARFVELDGAPVESRPFFDATIEDMANWREYLKKFEDKTTTPLQPAAVFKEINKHATGDDIFAIDVGNVTMNSLRYLDMNPKQKFTTSALFATMGYGMGAAIAAKSAFPDRQVFNLVGDGAFAMIVQDLLTQVKYKQHVINVVFSNQHFGFIQDEQEDEGQPFYGIDFNDADWAQVGNAMGAVGIPVSTHDELVAAFEKAESIEGPVVIDVKITDERAIPVEDLAVDPKRFSAEEIAAFRKRYEAEDLFVLDDLIEKYSK